ncbi:hypothetical protein [Prevotellamassilia timonensis]|uniref:hypothetical protein n=1 Tax=Prevotellamassilia timonensis TaxID=1852370 RepID=UPI00307B2436
MKKTITLLGMLLAFFATAGAQTAVKYYSSTATPYANLVSGKSYAILVAADKNCVGTDYSTATFLSWATLDGSMATIDPYQSTNDLRGKVEQNGYTWVVTVNSDNTITLKTGNGKYVPAASNGGGGGLSTTAGNLTRVDKGEWCQLTGGAYNSKTCFLTLGGQQRDKKTRNKLEYYFYDANATNGEIAKFKFFEVLDGASLNNVVTYNYTINGTKVGTYSVLADLNNAYPTPGNLPDFVTATVPEGTVTGTTTKDIEVNISNYPFKFSLNESDTPEWGYLTGNISTADRKLFTNNTTSIVRSAANAAYQNSTLNGIADDLWRMVGNPFDGFKVMNKSGKCLVKAASGNGATYTNVSATESDNLWKVYGDDIIENSGKITDANKTDLMAKAFVLRHSTVGEGDNYLDAGGVSGTSIGTWRKKSNGACFLFLEPEFTVNLNTNDNLVASFATLALPFDFKVVSSNTNDAKLYSGAYNATTRTLDMTAVEGVVPANAGVVIKSDSKAENIVLTANAKAAATALTGNQLVGTTEEIAFSELTDKLVFGVTKIM